MICLNMIVRNEAEDLPKYLPSVKPYIDYYLIADTGSTDGTFDLIPKLLDGIEGKVFHHKWVNFGHNRDLILQEAYKKAFIDYIMIIDADEELVVTDEDIFKNLTAPRYDIERRLNNTTYWLPFLLNIKRAEWHWNGPAHNYITGCKTKPVFLKGVSIIHHYGKGGKSSGVDQKAKFLRDAELFEEELKRNPSDTRSQFYLGQSYKDAFEWQKAYDAYQKRIQMGKWQEEVYYSMYKSAKMKWMITKEFPLEDFLEAYNYRPNRIEALYEIADYYSKQKKYPLAYIFASMGYIVDPTEDILFVRKDIIEWRMADELAVAAYWVGQFQEAKTVCERLLASGKLPENEVERVRKNRNFAIGKLNGELGADYYDEVYKKETDFSRYDEIYRKAGEWAKGKVLDIGCGAGELSKYIEDYHGFDFSEVIIKHPNTWVGNAYTENLEGYDTYILLEVLEHLDDLRVLSRIPKGKNLIFSVPSFTDIAHMRTYTEESMRERFKGISIKEVVRFNWHNKWTQGKETDNYILLVRGKVGTRN